MTDKLKKFIKWVRNYPNDYIDSKTANNCIKVLHSDAKQSDKEMCLDMLAFYEGWNTSQMKRLFESYPHLNRDNQECLVDTQWYMYTEDLSAAEARQYLANEWFLLSKTQYDSVAEWAADDFVDFAHPYCMNKAIKNFNNTQHKWKRYAARNWFDNWGEDYKEVKNWGKKKKIAWFAKNPDYLRLPKWCLGDRPIYVYIFTEDTYPDKWGDISLPGTIKDMKTYQDLFRTVATEGIEFYQNEQANTSRFMKCIDSMKDKEDNAIHVFIYSGHGSWDSTGAHCILLNDFEYDYNRHTFVNTPNAGQIHHAVDMACSKSPNILPIFILDSCGSGGVATERAFQLNAKGLKVKSFHPEGWVPSTVPTELYEGIHRNSRELWIAACRPESYSYDSPDGGCFTLAFRDSFKVTRPIAKIMRKAGKKLMKQGTPSIPWLVTSGKGKFKFGKHK